MRDCSHVLAVECHFQKRNLLNNLQMRYTIHRSDNWCTLLQLQMVHLTSFYTKFQISCVDTVSRSPLNVGHSMDQSVNDTTRVITLHVPVCILKREAPVSLSRAEMHTLLVELCKEKEEIIKCHLCTAPILKSHLLQDSHHQLLETLAILILLAPLHMHHQINYCTRFLWHQLMQGKSQSCTYFHDYTGEYLLISCYHISILLFLSIPKRSCLLHHGICKAAPIVGLRTASSSVDGERLSQFIICLCRTQRL